MIPKIIHYCWFGKDHIPSEYKKYMESWKRMMPDYEIVEWNEDSFDIHVNRYCEEAFFKKKWAFVSDVARLYVILNYGGIYLDTDIELVKSLSPLLCNGSGYMGFQNPFEVTTGLGFAAEPNNKCIKRMLDIYDHRSFIKKDGSLDLIPCPAANTAAFKEFGLQTDKRASRAIQEIDGIKIYPVEYFNPMDRNTMKTTITDNTYSIHHYAGSWLNNNKSLKTIIKRVLPGPLLRIREKRVSLRDIRSVEAQIEGNKSKL